VERGSVASEDPEAVTSSHGDGRPVIRHAAVRTYALAAALIVVAGSALQRLDLAVEPAVGWSIPVWGVALLAFGSAFLVFNVEFRRETYTFTYSEFVLVVGLFFATPAAFIVGRLLGEFVFLTVRERQRPRKLVMNLSAYFAESVALVGIEQLVLGGLDVRDPVSWAVCLVAVVGAELVGYAAIATAVRWHGGPITLRSIIQIGLITAPANTSLALVVCVLVDAEPAAVPLLGCVAAFLVMTYRAYSSLKQRYDSLSLLYDFTHLVSGAREPDQVLDAMLSQAKDLLRAERAEFWLVTGGDTLRRHVVDDSGNSAARVTLPLALAALVPELRAGRDAALLTPASHEHAAVLADLGARDALIAPVVEGDLLIGFVAVINRLSEIYTFEPQDARMFATLASHAGVALQNGRLIVRLHEQARQREHEALHDPLTGLPNRAMFGDRLAERLDDGDMPSVGIALMDLDGFKEINDTLGHQSGDQVLVEVARRLRAAVADGMLAVRLGGDEFALIAAPGTSHAELELTCRRVRETIAEPMRIDHLTVNMGVSVGIAVAPGDGRDADTLIRRADIAMYAAKAGHDGGVCFYDAGRDENTPRRLALAHDMRVAVEAGQLRVVYQPKVSLADGHVTGVECLCRWDHPQFGLVPPDEFIPLAERTGAIGELTRWMLGEAIAQCERWLAEGRSWGVAINVSVRNLLDAGMVGSVHDALAGSTMPPSMLTLEITETHVMSDSVRTTHVLEELAALGVRLSVDDFGTGYSSLAYLQRLPVDEVKIDKSFVRALSSETGADAIVRSVLDLARNLDLWVVAEGVEDGATASRLRALDCDEAQGYFFARPMDAEDLERFAAEPFAMPGGPSPTLTMST
jgi:diguanylate cyclase (GGDEF)-like protein